MLTSAIEKKVHGFISEQLREQGCPVRIINGMPDHIHCLFLLNPQKNLSDLIKQIKGSSSHYINRNDLTTEKFSWQTGYAVFSVSESGVERVFQYIQNQKSHHKKRTYQDECEAFIELNGLNHQGFRGNIVKQS